MSERPSTPDPVNTSDPAPGPDPAAAAAAVATPAPVDATTVATSAAGDADLAGGAPPSRRRWPRWVLIAAAVVVALIVVGVTYQQVGAARDRSRWQPASLTDVGDHGLHLRCSGPAGTAPTVVLEAASGGAAAEWAWVQRALEPDLRVCSYDRAGRGWSTGSTPDSAAAVVTDLRTALRAVGEPGPYLLVGHSFGGIYVREFHRLHPADVAGIVLVDSAHPAEAELLGSVHDGGDGGLGWARLVAPVGLMRLYAATGGLGFGDLPADADREMRALWSSPRHLGSMRAELAASGRIRDGVADLGPLGDLPTAVVSAQDELFDGWAVLQADLAGVADDVVATTVPGSTHRSLLYDEDHAAVVAGAVRDLAARIARGPAVVQGAS